jgi:hypothetical protein
MITIDKLSLQLSGFSQEEGLNLARILAQDLALVTLPEGVAPDLRSLSVSATPVPGASLQALSQSIVEDVLRQLSRTF